MRQITRFAPGCGCRTQRSESERGRVIRILGIDVGGSGIEGAPVDTRRGKLLAECHRIVTPQPATPRAVARIVGEVARHFDWKGPIGCAVPAVVKDGRLRTAANISRSWLGVDAVARFAGATGCPVSVINDADAAGYAEMHFGAGTAGLDRPMRNASENQQMAAAILEDLKLQEKRAQ